MNMKIVFTHRGDFEAVRAAEAWCSERGISVGAMQGPAPRGLRYGDYNIHKWRNLRKREIAALDGMMTGDMRNGPVYVDVRDLPPNAQVNWPQIAAHRSQK